MIFQNPAYLFGLFAIALPIIIHLFNFQKYKPVLFSNLQFLLNIQSKTKRHSQLKRLILLFLRILIIISLVFAFAQPILPENNKLKNISNSNFHALYIDNSQSMTGLNEEGISLLDEAKQKSHEIIEEFGLNDKFMILSNNFDGGSFRFINRDEALLAIDELKISNLTRNFDDVIKRINDEFTKIETGSKFISIISDFQKPSSDINFTLFDSNTTSLLFLLEHKIKSNIYIDSCWFELPIVKSNQLLTLNVSIRNESDENFDMMPVSLKINGEDISSAVFDIQAGTSKIVKLNYIEKNTGICYCEIKTDDKGPFNYDDEFYFTYNIQNNINVLELFEKNPSTYLKALYLSDSIFSYTSVGIRNIDYSSLNNYDLIIISDLSDIASGTTTELQKYVSNGGVLLIIPSIEADPTKLNSFSQVISNVQYQGIDTTKTQISEISSEFMLFRNVFEELPHIIDLPTISKRFRLVPQTTLIPIIKLMDGNVFLGLNKQDAGEIYYLSATLNDQSGNFHRHALIVPTLLNLALYAKKNQDIYYIIGSTNKISIKTPDLKMDDAIRLINIKSKKEFIPASSILSNKIQLSIFSTDIEPNNYQMVSSGSIISGIAFNRNPSESKMVFQNREQINKIIKDNQLMNVKVAERNQSIQKIIQSALNHGKSLKGGLILISLLLIIIETFVLRFYK